ncbi:MAG: hypothetical protein QF872_06290, partial [Gammaproteobacteria bacterium]|nr:hypothetical protein [Gammaproteobacteria bacterium]
DQWVEIRSFRWEDWVNTGWDEAINCSVFADRLNDRVMNAISNPIVEGAAPECLAALEFCDEMRVIYGDVASQLITPLCESLQGDE